MTVNLFKEHDKAKNFYIQSSKNDIATDLTMEEVVVLHNPKQIYNKEIMGIGYEFNINIKSNVKHWLSRI